MRTSFKQVAGAFILTLLHLQSLAVDPASRPIVDRIDPPFWFVGMEQTTLQLLVHGSHLKGCSVRLDGCARLVRTEEVTNANYLFLYLDISTCQPSELTLTFSSGRRKVEMKYDLRPKSSISEPSDGGTARIDGLNTSDFMYLLMPDRFANGDYSNDVVPEMNETVLNRGWMYDRHGGDIQGIINHLDYFEELGVTALWLNPVLENDEFKTSYHGYAATDSYRIDRRYGSNELYAELGEQMRKRGMKLIKDVIYNHWGDQHWMILDPPDSTWVNRWPEFTRTSHRPFPLWDPYGSEYDRKIFTEGWFDHHMPDLNQRNPLLADYLIQNTLWWIEVAGLDGLRIDTYYYPDQEFMANLVERVAQEYPDCFVFGECWIKDPIALNWVTDGVGYRDLKPSSMKSVTDFPLYFATLDALTKSPGWEEGPIQWYLTLAADVLLEEKPDHVVFLDNHDLSRYYSMVNEDYARYEIGIAFLMTTRGIPMIYYGTEILMSNYCDPDGKVRSDFPGGWKEDLKNKFEASGRTREEARAFEFIKTLANWRKNNPWIGDADLKHFVPQDNVYVYFRTDPNSGRTALVILNPQDKDVRLDLTRYKEILPMNCFVKNVITGKDRTLGEGFSIEAKDYRIFEVIK